MRLITIFFFVISLAAHGQDTLNNQVKQQMRKWYLGAVVSPDLCYRTLKNTDSKFDIAYFNNSEIPKFGYTAGLAAAYGLSSNWTIETGLLFSNKGYKTKMIDIESLDFSDSILGKGRVYFNFYYLDVPVKINYAYGHGKIRFCATLGITTNIFLDAKTRAILKYNDGHVEHSKGTNINPINAINISPMAGVGIDWRLTERMKLKIEPTFRYGLLSIGDGWYFDDYLWNAGLNMGFYYSLGKSKVSDEIQAPVK